MYQGAFCGGQTPEVAPNVNTLLSTLPQASQSIVELFSWGDKKKEGIEKTIKSLLTECTVLCQCGGDSGKKVLQQQQENKH